MAQTPTSVEKIGLTLGGKGRILEKTSLRITVATDKLAGLYHWSILAFHRCICMEIYFITHFKRCTMQLLLRTENKQKNRVLDTETVVCRS